MKKERRIYSLVARNSRTGEEKIVKLKEFDEKKQQEIYKTKVYLSTIDKHITTYFNDKKQLLNYLKAKEIIPQNMNDIEINYQYKYVRTVQLVFKENQKINQISKSSATVLNFPDNQQIFDETYKKLINLCNDTRFLKIIFESDSLSLKLKESLNKILSFQNFNEEDYIEQRNVISSLEEELKKYKNFRAVLLIIGAFEHRQDRISEKNAYEEDYETEEFLSEEEIIGSYGEIIDGVGHTKILKV